MPPQHAPFEGFEYMFGGGNASGSNIFSPKKEKIDNTKLYKVLEVSKDATSKEIKTSFRRLSKLYHPDREGGDEEKFKEINEAYEILSDQSKRETYDKYGLDAALDNNNSAAAGMSRYHHHEGPRKGPNVNYPLRVSLEELYNGKTRKLAINRKLIVGETKKCEKCDGRGAVLEQRELGPGMITQMQRTCQDCQGYGETFETKNERKVIEVHIDKGMVNQQKIRFRNMADEYPNLETGDVNIIIEEKDHPLFKRKGADLLVVKEISLNQALCGWTWKFNHLDNRTIVVRSKPGEEILNGDIVKMIKNEGMPSYGNPFVRGNLYVKFNIKFPDALDEEQIRTLKETLPEPDTPVTTPTRPESEQDDNEFIEDVEMEDANPINFGKGGASSSNNSEYDSDNEMDAEPIQCQQS